MHDLSEFYLTPPLGVNEANLRGSQESCHKSVLIL
jgi:hypothetical protein